MDKKRKTNDYRWKIFIAELSRAWDWYIGLPVKPRSWSIERKRYDEL